MDLDTPLTKIAGIGPVYISKLGRLGISSISDLIYHFPSRFEDLSQIKNIADLIPDEVATVRGAVWESRNIKTRRGKFLTKILVNDGTGSVEISFFNQPYLTKQLKNGVSVSLAGKVSVYKGRITMISPDWEMGGARRHTGRLVPIYPETEGLSSKWLRGRIQIILPEVSDKIIDYLPREVISRYQLTPLKEAILQIHEPKNFGEVEKARRRLGFEELFLTNLSSLIRKKSWQKSRGPIFSVSSDEVAAFISTLPFQLTSAQNKVLKEILSDFSKPSPMNRLLQGEVGSGKTVVAAVAAYVAYKNGYEVALMAPTEILAEQHFRTLSSILTPANIKVGLRTGSRKEDSGEVVVGTHALLSKNKEFRRLGLVIIDEQHRFGVAQRSALKEKGDYPHLLTMTATPIPRTLALTHYGDLDLSFLDELPPGRKIVKTFLVPSEKRNKSYEFLREKIKLGGQAFVVTPLIEPSETLTSVKSAREEFERLKEEVFPDLNLGLLHGRLPSKEKEKVLQDFRERKTSILVTTPVVEVGIDIPNATIMVIEGAERFGLAQLHQLRGRIGRGNEESFCLLFSEDESVETTTRLKALQTHHLGVELAEIDLKLRGPGELYGFRQSGLPDLKIARLSDTELLSETRAAAEEYLEKNKKIPAQLSQRMSNFLNFTSTSD